MEEKDKKRRGSVEQKIRKEFESLQEEPREIKREKEGVQFERRYTERAQ